MTDDPLILLPIVALATAGLGFTLLQTREMVAVEGQHWIMLVVVLVVGYVLGRLWATPAQMAGLP